MNYLPALKILLGGSFAPDLFSCSNPLSGTQAQCPVSNRTYRLCVLKNAGEYV